MIDKIIDGWQKLERIYSVSYDLSIVGIYFIRVINKINPDLPDYNFFDSSLDNIFTSLFFIVYSAKLSLKFFENWKEVKETKKWSKKNLKTETVERFNLLTSLISMLSQKFDK
jgi:hypothetical protein